MKNVLVFFGGESCEHDVSVITGVMAQNAVDKKQYFPLPIYVGKNGRWYTHTKLNDVSVFKNLNLQSLEEVAILPSDNTLYKIKKGKLKRICEIYSAINCCHGGEGEGGGLSAVLRQSKIPCTSADEFASSLAMDKEFTKIALKGIGVKCLSCVRIDRDKFYLRKETALRLIELRLGFPVIVKPAKLGSSIGIKLAKDEKELERALTVAFGFDERVIIERALQSFREINCAVYKSGGEIIASECEEPILNGEMLSFEDKYKAPTKKTFPAEIDLKLAEKIKKTAKTVYERFKFSGVIRIDFLLENEEVYLNEINAVPGSLAYYLFCKSTADFGGFLSRLIEESVDDYKMSLQKTTTFQSGVLNISSCKTKR